MAARTLITLVCLAELLALISAGGHGGGHKKVVIHVPLYVKHHHHKHTIVKHVHHKHGGGGGDDHYEVLGYTYGEPKSSGGHGHFGGGHGWAAADEGSEDSPVSFEGDHGAGGFSASGGDFGGEEIGGY